VETLKAALMNWQSEKSVSQCLKTERPAAVLQRGRNAPQQAGSAVRFPPSPSRLSARFCHGMKCPPPAGAMAKARRRQRGTRRSEMLSMFFQPNAQTVHNAEKEV